MKGLKQKENIHLIRGTIVHKVLADFISSDMARDENAGFDEMLNELNFSLKTEWFGNKEKFLKLPLQPQDMAFYYDQSKRMLINWLHSYLKLKIYKYPVPATEVMLFSKPYKLCGRVDAI